MANAWYCIIDGEELGPLDKEKVQQLIAAGSLAASDLVRREDWAQWKETAETNELQAQPPKRRKKKKKRKSKNKPSVVEGLLQSLGYYAPLIAVGAAVSLFGLLLAGAASFLSSEPVSVQKRFVGDYDQAAATGGKTTSEWLALYKEYRNEKHPARKGLLAKRVGKAAMFIGADPAAFPALLDALGDDDVRHVADAVLGKFDKQTPPTLEDIEKGLDHEVAEAREWSYKLLYTLYPDVAEQVAESAKEKTKTAPH